MARRRRVARLESLESRCLLAGLNDMADDASTAWLTQAEGEGSLTANYAAGELLVRFAANVTAAEREQLVASQGGEIVRYMPRFGTALVRVPEATVIPEAAAQWTALPEVTLAEANNIGSWDQLLPNDPIFPSQWHLNNTGQNPPLGTPDADVDAPEAWEIFTGTPDVVVAVFDSGVDYTHPDLINRLWRNDLEIPGDGIDNDGNGFIDDYIGVDTGALTGDPFDTVGHGTFTIGVIGAEGNNNLGTVGVDWHSQVMAIRLGALPSEASALIGLDYMLNMKARGVNVVASNHSYGLGPVRSPIMEFAIQQSIDAGILFVASAGNGGADGIGDNNDFVPQFPANYNLDGVISVAATDLNDNLGLFSNFGPNTVDLAAPGVDVWSTTLLSAGGIGINSGTSFSAPHVAGAVGLLAGLAPELSALEIQDALLRGADPLDTLEDMVITGGRLNLMGAIRELPSGSISGRVFHDVDGDGTQDPVEIGIPNVTVFMDVDGDGSIGVGEPTATTTFDGQYTITNYRGPGSYIIRQVALPGFTPTVPASGARTVVVSNRQQDVTGVDFGNRIDAGEVTGLIFHDIDESGSYDPEIDEPLEGFHVYLDLDDNERLSLTEPAVRTNEDGTFAFDLTRPGEYIVRYTLEPGWERTLPVADDFQVITVGPNGSQSGVNFGFRSYVDYGTAPAPYPRGSAGKVDGFQLGDTFADDGTSFPANLFAGQTGTVRVDVKTIDMPRGYLQMWMDINDDGDWNDAGEQVITNVRLGTGVHDVNFQVPAGTTPGNVQTRVRFGYERFIGPGDAAQAGEIEDYVSLVLGNSPQANPDSYSLPQGVVDEVLDVLDNDLPSASGGTRIVEVSSPGPNAMVRISPLGDHLIFSAAPNFSSPPVLSFTYTIRDAQNNRSTAQVSVNIEAAIQNPVAIDDSFTVQEGSVNNPLDVLANDLPGVNPPIQLIGVSDPPNGTAMIDNRGTPLDPTDDRLLYRPDAGFGGTDQFTYTILGNGVTSTATVTVQVEPGASADNQLDITLQITDDRGNDLTSVAVGQEFRLNVFVEDIRANPPVSQEGVFAAYLDLLYDSKLVSVVPSATNPLDFQVMFGSSFGNGASGDPRLPGVIDEFGAFALSQNPLGLGPFLLASITMVAEAPGVATFLGDPADQVTPAMPQHQSFLFEPTTPVPINRIGYGFDDLIITGGAAAFNSLDTDTNGVVSPGDVLNVINFLNNNGPMALLPLASGGEGESGASTSPFKRLDANADNFISAADALVIINYLNDAGAGEGEGPGASGGLAEIDLLQASDPWQTLGQSLDVLSQDAPAASRILVPVDNSTLERRQPETPASLDRSRSVSASGREAVVVPPASYGQDRLPNSSSFAPGREAIGGESLEELLDDLAHDISRAWGDDS